MSLSISDVNAIIATSLPSRASQVKQEEAAVSAPAAAAPSAIATFAATTNPAIIATQATAARIGLGL